MQTALTIMVAESLPAEKKELQRFSVLLHARLMKRPSVREEDFYQIEKFITQQCICSANNDTLMILFKNNIHD